MAKGGTNVKTVAELLRAKPARVVSVSPEQSVLEAIKVLAAEDIGAAIVMSGGRLAGIFSERDCKGAYQEPSTVAFASKADVDTNYVKLMKLLFDEGVDPAVASHDEKIVREALAYTKGRGIGPERFEFQMLYGIRRDLQREITAAGQRLRLYVPYGDAWYPYFMRRLAERPANVVFLLRNLLKS